MFHLRHTAIALLLPIGVMTACTGAALQDKEEEPVRDPRDIAPIIIVYFPPRPVIHHAAGMQVPPEKTQAAVTCKVEEASATLTLTFDQPEGAVGITLENEGTCAVSRAEADSASPVVIPLDAPPGRWTLTLTTEAGRTYGGSVVL